MYVTEIMTPAPVTCAPGDKADYAAKLMLSHNCGEIPVCDGPRIIGVVTDRDIAIRAVAGEEPARRRGAHADDAAGLHRRCRARRRQSRRSDGAEARAPAPRHRPQRPPGRNRVA